LKPVDFHPDAAQEANDAVDYYDMLRPGLGDDFRTELAAIVQLVVAEPPSPCRRVAKERARAARRCNPTRLTKRCI